MKNNFTLCCILLIAGMSSFMQAKAQVNVDDSLALVDLYNSTNGLGWYYSKNWLTEQPVSTWSGIKVKENRVTQVYLSFNNLSGTIPSSIGNLTGLRYLNLQQNQLSGSIPDTIGNLTRLSYLNLSSNPLSGSIPSTIGHLKHIQYLSITATQVSGTIPTTIGKLKRLTQLVLVQNQLTGIIPYSIGKCSNLEDLELQYNNLTGDIPSSIGKLTNLTRLVLRRNALTGSIPYSFRNLSNLTELDLTYNNLTQVGNSTRVFQRKQKIKIEVYRNMFTFDGLEFIVQNFQRPSYAPQHKIRIHQHGDALAVYAGGTLSNNTYKWVRVGSQDTTVINGDSTFQPAVSGDYRVWITNSIVTQPQPHTRNLILESYPFSYTAPETAVSKTANPNVATKSIVTTHFSVYPNPVSTLVHVQTDGNAIVSLINAAGKVLLTKTINRQGEINVSAVAPGLYYLQNKTSGELQKLVITH